MLDRYLDVLGTAKMGLVLRGAGGGERDSWSDVGVTAEVEGGVGRDVFFVAGAKAVPDLRVCFFCFDQKPRSNHCGDDVIWLDHNSQSDPEITPIVQLDYLSVFFALSLSLSAL
jgi:hypothetical protein